MATASDLNIPAQIVGEGPVIDLVFTEKPVRNYGDFLASDRNRQSQLLSSLKEHGILKGSVRTQRSSPKIPNIHRLRSSKS